MRKELITTGMKSRNAAIYKDSILRVTRLENHASAAMAMLMAGVEYPLTTTALGAGWLLGRMVYALGYTRKDRSDGKGRLAGSFFWLFQFGLFGLAGWVCFPS